MHFCGRDFVHAELIDPGATAPLPLDDGAEGELVYTSLRREAMPVVRFRSRDRVVVTARPCSCGRTGVRVRCIGRTDDLLIVRGVEPLPVRRARGGGGVPPARRRPGADPAGPHGRAPGRAAAGPRRAGGGCRGDAELSGAIQVAIRGRLVASTAVELVPYGALADAASTRAGWWTSRSPWSADERQWRLGRGGFEVPRPHLVA